MSFKDVNLESVMLQPGDLPSSLFAGQVYSLPEDEYFAYDTAYSQGINTKNGQRAGEVRVYLFPDARERDKMYDLLTLMETQEGIIVFETPLIGDAASAHQGMSGSDILHINLTFVECYAVANIELQTTDDFVLNGNDIIAYAEKLATRLNSIACP
jgi:hypothetical protein